MYGCIFNANNWGHTPLILSSTPTTNFVFRHLFDIFMHANSPTMNALNNMSSRHPSHFCVYTNGWWIFVFLFVTYISWNPLQFSSISAYQAYGRTPYFFIPLQLTPSYSLFVLINNLKSAPLHTLYKMSPPLHVRHAIPKISHYTGSYNFSLNFEPSIFVWTKCHKITDSTTFHIGDWLICIQYGRSKLITLYKYIPSPTQFILLHLRFFQFYRRFEMLGACYNMAISM